MYENITKNLKSVARDDDKKAFGEYAKGRITIDEFMKWVFDNNGFSQDARNLITAMEFHDWFTSLGWKRRCIRYRG